MALQIQVTAVDATPEGDGGNVTVNLKCWEEGADPKTDTPVIEEDKVVYVKKGVENMTKQQLVDRAAVEVTPYLQEKINLWYKKQELLTMIDTTAIENGLSG